MIVARITSLEETGQEPVSFKDVIYVQKLIHNCDLDENIKGNMEIKLDKAELQEELFEVINYLKMHQRKNLNEQFEEALRRDL